MEDMFLEIGKQNKSVNEKKNVFKHLKKGTVLNYVDKISRFIHCVELGVDTVVRAKKILGTEI